MIWQIESFNSTDKELRVDGFHLWFSLAYVMFRDDNVVRNIRQSCAVFAHMGGDFSKFAAIRRSNEAPHLGIYGKRGVPRRSVHFADMKIAFWSRCRHRLTGCCSIAYRSSRMAARCRNRQQSIGFTGMSMIR